MSQDITFMTPGSVWLRDNGKMSTLLFLTNLNLKAKVQERFPPQAVYLNEDGEVLTQDIDTFMANRTFFNVSPEVETLVDKLLAYRDGSVEADEAEAELEIDDSEVELEIVEDGEQLESSVELEAAAAAPISAAPVLFISFSEEASDYHKAVAEVLNSAVLTYQQAPLFETLTDHIIEFDKAKLEESGITMPGLESMFDPDSPNGVIPSFVVNGNFKVTWSTYVGVFAKMSPRKSLVCLHLGTDTPSAVDQKIAEEFAKDAIIEDAAAAPALEAAVADAAVADQAPQTLEVTVA